MNNQDPGSFLHQCQICACKEFVPSPYQPAKCINCFHSHAPPEYYLKNNIPDPNQRGKLNSPNTQRKKDDGSAPQQMYSRVTMRVIPQQSINTIQRGMSAAQLSSPSSANNQQPTTNNNAKPQNSLPNKFSNPIRSNSTNNIVRTPSTSKAQATAVPSQQHSSRRPVPSPPSPLSTGLTEEQLLQRPLPQVPSHAPHRVTSVTNPGDIEQNVSDLKISSSNENNSDQTTNGTNSLPIIKKLTNEEFRAMKAQEVLDSERVYLNFIRKLIDTFLLPLRKDNKAGKDFESIFGNIEEIAKINDEFLKRIEESVSTWTPESKIGNVFLDLGPYLKPYYTKYTENYQNAQSTLNECEKQPSFLQWIEKAQEQAGQTIRSLLIMPVQRIPRYVLLLEDFVKNTSPDHCDYNNLVQSLEKMKGIATDINQAIKAGENRQKMINIQNSFLSDVKILEPHRTYIRDGALLKICRSSKKQRWFFLFNDLLLHASCITSGSLISLNKYLLHQTFKLADLRIQDVPDEGNTPFTFQIVTASKSFSVRASSQEEKVSWLLDLMSAIDICNAKRATFGDVQDGVRLEAPVWDPDDSVKNCPICSKKFNQISRRKHHCRACGKVVCDSCSSQRVQLANLGSSLVRVCDLCYMDLTNTLVPPKT